MNRRRFISALSIALGSIVNVGTVSGEERRRKEAPKRPKRGNTLASISLTKTDRKVDENDSDSVIIEYDELPRNEKKVLEKSTAKGRIEPRSKLWSRISEYREPFYLGLGSNAKLVTSEVYVRKENDLYLTSRGE